MQERLGRAPRPFLELFPPADGLPPEPEAAATASPVVAPVDDAVLRGRQQRPFAPDATDLKFLYHSAPHDRAAQAMLSSIRRRDGIVVLTGTAGIGKTMLCRAVMEQLDRRTLCSLVSEPFVSDDELLKTVLIDFGVISRADLEAGRLSHATRANLMNALRDFLATLAPLHAFAVIVIDDADSVPATLLRDLARLDESDRAEHVLEVVLVGQPALLATLARSPLKAVDRRVALRCTLGPLASDEVGAYVDHRLAAAGGDSGIRFDEDALRKIYELSGGVPRTVNLLCDRALTASSDSFANRVDEHLITSAAEDLEIDRPHAAGRALRILAWVLLFVVMMVAGAALALLLLGVDPAATVRAWQEMF